MSNDALINYFNFLIKNKPGQTSVDECHGLLLFGLIVSLKPSKILELGVGTGYITKTILSAINYNEKGKLICVDNLKDYKGNKPNFINELEKEGIIFNNEDETLFLKNVKDKYDLIIADADHSRINENINFYPKILNKNGFMLIHDVNFVLENSYLFNKSSLLKERCSRGWLLFFKENYKIFL